MIAQGDAVRIPLPDQSVHCAVTSPPYWGLRKYAGEQGEEPLGLEPTPERHVERIVEICREVRRVLRDDGVFWLNYGDCYAGGGRGPSESLNKNNPHSHYAGPSTADLSQGSLMMMPHRVALALQQDGWIVRQDLVWFKRNPMPESVNGWRWQRERTKKASQKSIEQGRYEIEADLHKRAGVDEDWLAEYEYGEDLELRKGSWRHTRAHEYVFMLVKGMQYWSNQEAVREALSLPEAADGSRIFGGNQKHGANAKHGERTTGRAYEHAPSGRNPRSVLDVPTAPYRGAHYATFPPNLIAPLIRATCPRWACPVCGQGWAPVVNQQFNQTGRDRDNTSGGESDMKGWEGIPRGINQSNVLGYRKTCEHEHTQEEAVPGIVFDPFCRSGTSVMVAQQLLRRGIGIDISMEYLDQQAKIRAGLGTPSNALDDLPLFAETPCKQL